MKKKKIDILYQLDHIVPFLDDDFEYKMEFAKSFLNSCNVSGLDEEKVWMGSVRMKTLIYLIYAIITEYDQANMRFEYLQKNFPPEETNSSCTTST